MRGDLGTGGSSRRVACVAIACALGASACNGRAASGSPAADPPASAKAASTAEPAQAEPKTPKGPPPVIRLTATPDRRTGTPVAWSLQNRDREPVKLGPRVRLERQVGDGYEPFDAKLELRPDCERPAPACMSLVPGGELVPPPWLGTAGDAQCACEGCAEAPEGRYRLVVEGCDGAFRLEGEPFELARR